MSGSLPGAGCGVCGSRPLLAVLLGWVVHSVTGQQGEDEVRRLSAEIWLTFNLTRLSYLTKLLIIHTCTKDDTFECLQFAQQVITIRLQIIYMNVSDTNMFFTDQILCF